MINKAREYQESEIGYIPNDWHVSRVKDEFTLINGFPFDSNKFDIEDGYPVIRIRDLNQDTTEAKYKGEWVDSASVSSSDLLIGMDGDFNVGRWLGTGKALLNQRTCCLRGEEYISKFAEYYLPAELKVINDVTYATTVKHLSSLQINKIKIPIPPGAELKKIVLFLNRETAKIDELIQRQQKLILLAEEERRAIINQAICRGLDQKIKLQDSGISWLGEIPAHWNIKPLKHLISLNDEVLPESTPEDFELNYVEIGDVSERFGITNSTEVLYKNAASRARRLVKHGDILISTVRTYLRAIAPVINPPSNMVVSTGFAVIRPRKLNNDYARFLLSTEYFLNEVISRSTGVSYPAINASDLIQIKVPVPPVEEQQKIAEYIQKKCVSLELLVNKSETSIKLLWEHRASLISAAVTGKIDVRESV